MHHINQPYPAPFWTPHNPVQKSVNGSTASSLESSPRSTNLALSFSRPAALTRGTFVRLQALIYTSAWDASYWRGIARSLYLCCRLFCARLVLSRRDSE